jgi:hypothetical protein
MKCHKCKSENILRAKYCQKCGKEFTEDERKEAYNKTIFGKIEFVEKIKSIVTLNIITGSIFFKIASLMVVLGIGLYFLFTFGINTKILGSKDYQTFFNKKSSEYYIVVDDSKDSVELNLYRPNRTKEMIIYKYDLEEKEKDKKSVSRDDEIILDISEDDYYIIESIYSNKKQDKFKIYVYHKNDIPYDK